jgi:Mg-chelatase subunit ChlD
VLLLLLLALTGPRLNVGGRGLDVIVVADRSRSMSARSAANIQELILNLQNDIATRVNSGNRLGLVAVGSQAQIEYDLTDRIRQSEFVKVINPDGSDLNDGILTALDLVDPNRPARILVLSDGESNGVDPMSAARRAREDGVPIDCRLFERLRIGDIAIESVLLPESVVPLEPFQFSVWVYADQPGTGVVTVSRQGKQIAEREQEFARGMNQVLFRDLLEESGFFNYSVALKIEGDPVTENNVGAGLVRVEAGPRVLLLNADGDLGNLGRALQAGRIPFDICAAEDHLLTQDSLDRYRTVILENVKAADLGRVKMERLAQFVEDLGGGLLMTGGERSFGAGGYFKSPLDDVLPVSMELREEHRKNRVAITIALDRSGSMSAPVAGGKTKMDLANLGTAECVRLLSPQDMVSAIAVDSSPHIIQELTNVDDPEAIAQKVLGINSQGGGIYVYEALVAAGQQLAKAEGYQTRHIILFSDAQDSEEPGDYKKLLAKFSANGITVSVIGLGTKADSDAKLLEDIAKLGGGNIMFTADAQELPRMFTQDTMSVARNTFIKAHDEDFPNGFPGELIPDGRLLGDLGLGAFPAADGYNLSYLKPDATAAVLSKDEYQAPWSSFWYRGIGRVAAITLEVDGPYSGAFGKWHDYENFLVTHVRWLLGGKNPNEVFVKLEQAGQDAVVQVELDPDRQNQDTTRPPILIVVPPGHERTETLTPDFVWTGPNTLEARFRMDRLGSYRTLVKTGAQEFTRGPAVTIPYSPEFAPRIGLPDGSQVLQSIAELSNGKIRTDILELFDDPPRTSRSISLLSWLLIAAISIVVLEIAGRRLSLWERLADFKTAIPKLPTGEEVNMRTPAKPATGAAAWVAKWRARRQEKTAQATAAKKAAAASIAVEQKAPQPKEQPAEPQSARALFEQAKKRAQRHLK